MGWKIYQLFTGAFSNGTRFCVAKRKKSFAPNVLSKKVFLSEWYKIVMQKIYFDI